MTETRGAYLMNLGQVGYHEAWELQRSLAAAVGQGAIPDTVLLLEHPPTITLGRRTEAGEVHIPSGVVGRARRDRIAAASRPTTGPASSSATRSSTSTGTGATSSSTAGTSRRRSSARSRRFGIEATRIDGLTGVWLQLAAAGRSRRSASTSHAGSRRTGTRSTSTSTRRRSPSGSPPAGSTTPPSRRSRSRPARSRSTTSGTGGRRARRGVRPDARRAPGHEAGLWPQPLHEQLSAAVQRIPVSIAKLGVAACPDGHLRGWIRMPAERARRRDLRGG